MIEDSNTSIDQGQGSTISCHNLQYAVKTGGRCTKGDELEILKGITGVYEPGMNAILGPTGSGKTSLLDILAGRKDKAGIKGEVLINGNDLPSNFKCCSGYVVQDDVVMGTLTVRENLAFSAALRLPSSISRKEKRNRVDDIIDELGLNDCKDTQVGTVFTRGVSGGERKRTNVGMELIIKPTVLFLDEPTTGLDATTAHSVMSRLARLSKRGCTVIFSIHQPRYTIFRLFDKLHLLAKGVTIYHGPAKDSLEYFSSIGYECEAHNNPPDFFLDVIIENAIATPPPADSNESSESALKMEEGKGTEMNDVQAETGKVSLAERYKSSRFYQELEEKSAEIIKMRKESPETMTLPNYNYATGFFTQVAVVSRRAAMNFRRSFQISIVQPIMSIFFAFVLGLVYFEVDLSNPAGLQNRTGAFFFCSIFMIFSNMAALELFIIERQIFMHESSSGFYRTSSYFIGKVVCDLLPMRLIPTIIFSVVYYWLIGFRAEPGAFFIFVLTLTLATFCGTGLVFLISILTGIISVATVFITAINILMFVFAGVIVNSESIPDWLEWVKYLSIIRYSVNALSINEFKGLEFCSRNATHITGMCMTGEQYLEAFAGLSTGHWDLWLNHVALTCIMILLFILSYIALLRVPKYK